MIQNRWEDGQIPKLSENSRNNIKKNKFTFGISLKDQRKESKKKTTRDFILWKNHIFSSSILNVKDKNCYIVIIINHL